MELHKHEKKLNLNKLSHDDVDSLSVQLGQRVAEITDEAVMKVNALLAVYGMSAKMAIQFDSLPAKSSKKPKSPSKKTKKIKQDNLK